MFQFILTDEFVENTNNLKHPALSLVELLVSHDGAVHVELASFLTHRERRHIVELCHAIAYSAVREWFFASSTLVLPSSMEAAVRLLYALTPTLGAFVTSVRFLDPRFQELAILAAPSLPNLKAVLIGEPELGDILYYPSTTLSTRWPKSVTTLNLKHADNIDEVSTALTICSHFKHLKLRSFDSMEATLMMQQLQELVSLSIGLHSTRESRDLNLACFRSCSSLLALHVSGDYSGAGVVLDLSPLGVLRRLEKLRISGERRCTGLLPVLESSGASLQSLKLETHQHISRAESSALSTLGSLKRLELPRLKDPDLTAIAKLTKLEVLVLTMTSGMDWSPLAKLVRLKELDQKAVWNRDDVAQFAVLAKLPRLQILTRPVAVSGTPPLMHIRKLTVCAEYADLLPDLTKWGQLDDICWSNQASSDLLQGFPRTLRRLSMDLHVDMDCSVLAEFTQLRSLRLESIVESVHTFSFLSGLVLLENLNLQESPISDLTVLGAMTRLTNLNLYGTQVTDVSPLAGLMQLEWIDLGETSVSDVGPLNGLRNLRRLYLPEYEEMQGAQGLRARGIAVELTSRPE
ncbi:hypothetical protein BBJ28_00004823 [Nothophytophthora sp. Chile5]|nr:hypothetical protein BBJ28_00004823 [Nothophytophthora sp. Chile5]